MSNGVDYLGELDAPAAWAQVRGDLLQVTGWALLGGRPAARVEVFTDGADVAMGRTQLPRPDVAAAYPHLVHAATSGYEARITVDLPPGDERTVGLRVRVRSTDGAEWTSPLRFCTVRNPGVDQEDERQAQLFASNTTRLLAAVRSRGANGRVVAFTHSLGIGGGQLWLHELLTGLVKQHGWSAMVISPEDGVLRGDCDDLGVPVHITSHYRLKTVADYEGHVAELALLAASSGASVALVNTLGAFGGADAAKRAGLPTAWALHESFSLADFSFLNWGPAGLPAVVRARWERALADADRLVFVADATREMYLPYSSADRCRTVRYGSPMVDLGGRIPARDRRRAREELGLPIDATVLLNVGVVEPRKGQGALVAAFDRLHRRFPDAVLAVVGAHRSDYSRSLERYVDQRGLAGQVRLVPIQRDPKPWYQAADLFVNSSDVESLPRSILEAVCCGLPVIATDVFGAREMVADGSSGWLFEPNDVDAMTVALLRAMEVPAAGRAELASRAWERLRDWLDPASYVAEYHHLLTELADSWTEND